MIGVKIVNKSNNPDPHYATPDSAGMDIRAFMEAPIRLESMERILIPTGLYMELPSGYEAQMRPRSGLAIKQGLTLLNTPGTIDADYRGEIKVILINLSKETQTIQPGERIAQMVIKKFEPIHWIKTDALTESERGEGGFGSTGKK